MSRLNLSVDIDRAPDDVWCYVTDLARTPEWRTTIRSIDPPSELVVGAPFAGTTRLLGRTWNWELEVTAMDPPRNFAYAVTKGVATPTVEYAVEPLGESTRFTMSGHVDRMGVFARLLEPFAIRALRRETRQHLDHLKARLEATPPPA